MRMRCDGQMNRNYIDCERRLDELFAEAFPLGSPALDDWVNIKFELRTIRKEELCVRNEVVEFAMEMERVLQENDHKSGWDRLDIDELFLRITMEYDEAFVAYSEKCIQDLRKEVIDIANCCMFLFHNYPDEVK